MDLFDRVAEERRALAELVAGLTDEQLATASLVPTWTVRDVVGHLATAELDNYLARAEHILEHGSEVPFEPFDRFAFRGRDDEKSLDELVDWFADLRARNLARFTELIGAGDLDRRGLHPALGEVTLRELLATWTVHDLDHVSQIFAGMAGSRDAAVGAWKTYLGILLRRDDPAAVPG